MITARAWSAIGAKPIGSIAGRAAQSAAARWQIVLTVATSRPGPDCQSYDWAWSVNLMTPGPSESRSSLFATGFAKPRIAAPPVPTTNSRMPRLAVDPTRRVLRREPLVVVVVAVDDDVRAGRVERVPERPDRGVVAVLVAGAEAGLVPDRHRAERGMRHEVGGEPLALLESAPQPPTFAQSASRTITCHVPRSYEYHVSPASLTAAAPK